ncbi:hypothetical protein ROA7450_04097 [Roseovarius albus]|uniref:Uncharacterized protein n=1 Tax=Roseovarius albus TaxID=1247867 RepID=A0A1X7A963_9RHOB|nr:hypothetical protein [Roseovarius albus]SLN73110.1 hypothetical protein ROA7450_04097 [Roseovarius albus]
MSTNFERFLEFAAFDLMSDMSPFFRMLRDVRTSEVVLLFMCSEGQIRPDFEKAQV